MIIYALCAALSANVPGLAETFSKAYSESRNRAKSYALNDKTEKPFDHLLKVRILTLFRPKYGLSLDLLLLFAGGLYFGGWGYGVSIAIGGGLAVYWGRNGSRLIPLGLVEFLGNAIGYGVGITVPRKQRAAQPQPVSTPAPAWDGS